MCNNTLNKGPRAASGSDNISAVRTSKKLMTQVELSAVKKAAGLIEEK
jgi:hypothetical protein